MSIKLSTPHIILVIEYFHSPKQFGHGYFTVYFFLSEDILNHIKLRCGMIANETDTIHKSQREIEVNN